MDVNRIFLGDCIEIMVRRIDKDSTSLIYADPPYNLSGKPLNLINNKTGGAFYKMNEKWDTWDYDKYVSFSEKWISGCKRVLKANGSLYISCTYHNIAEIIIAAKKAGFKLNNIITWFKTNAMPSITRRTFTHATEYVCWFVKGNNWKFKYDQLKKINPNRTKEGKEKQMRDFLDFIKFPIVQGKERLRGLNGRAMHPTQKPEKLLEIIITASSDKGDVVLDPFFGTGTTGMVASRLDRKWIGIEINKDYFKIASRRLSNEKEV